MEILSGQDVQDLNRGIQKLYTLHNPNTFGPKALLIVNQQLSQGALPIADWVNQQKLQHLDDLFQQFVRWFDTEASGAFGLQAAHTMAPSEWDDQDDPLNGGAIQALWSGATERDRLVLRLLRPHLLQAYTNAHRYQQLEKTLGQFQQCVNHLGLMILDCRGHIQYITPKALSWLETYFTKLSDGLGLPEQLWSWVQGQINDYPEGADQPPTASLPLQIEGLGRKLVIRLMVKSPSAGRQPDIADRYFLLMEEQALSGLKSLNRLGLSQRETEVLGCLMQGQDNKKIAAQLSLNIGTIRKHLENIYQKLGVQSRAETIAHVVEQLGWLHQNVA
jgi:DNA-binding CsgD family transcriptional regulator